MTITLELAPQVETSLSEKASQRGQTLDEYLTRLIERTARLPVDVDPDWGHLQQTFTPEQWSAAWRDWTASHAPVSHFVDDSRESNYEERGE